MAFHWQVLSYFCCRCRCRLRRRRFRFRLLRFYTKANQYHRMKHQTKWRKKWFIQFRESFRNCGTIFIRLRRWRRIGWWLNFYVFNMQMISATKSQNANAHSMTFFICLALLFTHNSIGDSLVWWSFLFRFMWI